MTAPAVTGLKASIAGCHTCGLASRIGAGHDHHCPRCGSPLHLRKTNSLERTWALVIAAAILYFPANLLPITHTSALGKVQSDTIMSGVLYFLKHGDWPLALVIFVASVAVPITQTAGRFIAASLVSRLNLPPADNSAMDGYAVRAGEVQPGSSQRVVLDLPAGARSGRP